MDAGARAVVCYGLPTPQEGMNVHASPFDLSGKTALVTGANTGIGQAIAVALANAGAAVVGVGRSAMDDTAALIEGRGGVSLPSAPISRR